jgi:hypothetical protein
MSDRAESAMDSTPGSKARKGVADALKAHVDLSLVAGGGSSIRAHDKSAIARPVLPNLSDAERERGVQLAARLANSHSA